MSGNEPDMTEDRAQFLACFLSPRGAGPLDLVGRATDVGKAAASLLGLPPQAATKFSHVDGKAMPNPSRPLTSVQAVDLANLQGRLQEEGERCQAEKLVSAARPTGDDTCADWTGPEGVFVLTRKGAALAWAVQAAIDEAGAAEAPEFEAGEAP